MRIFIILFHLIMIVKELFLGIQNGLSETWSYWRCYIALQFKQMKKDLQN